jgi:hypothetical protein
MIMKKYECIGKCCGKTKKEAEARFRKCHPKEAGTGKIELEHIFTTPFSLKVYEVTKKK